MEQRTSPQGPNPPFLVLHLPRHPELVLIVVLPAASNERTLAYWRSRDSFVAGMLVAKVGEA